jgi:hypothetical protein
VAVYSLCGRKSLKTKEDKKPRFLTERKTGMKPIKKTYLFDALEVDVIMEKKVWRIPSTAALHEFIEKDPKHLNVLYKKLQQDHIELFGSPIKIRRKSFVVEVWAHLFVEKFLEMASFFTRFVFFDRLFKQIISHTSVIDCGESPLDSNRKIWDQVAKLFDPVSNRITSQ